MSYHTEYADNWNGKKNEAANSAQNRQNADSKLRDVQTNRDRMYGQIRNGTAEMEQNFNNRLDDIKHQMEGDLQKAEEEIRLQVDRQLAACRHELGEIRRLANDNSHRTDELEHRIGNVTEQLREALRQLADKENSRTVRALALQSQLRTLEQQLLTLHPDKLEPLHQELLVPGVSTVQQSLAYIQGNIDEGDFEAAIGLAQTSICNAVYMIEQLTALNREFEKARVSAEDERTNIRSRMEDAGYQTLHLEFVIGSARYLNEQDEPPNDINYWSDGLYSDIQNQIARLEESLDISIGNMDTDSINRVKEDLNRVDNDINICVDAARVEFEMSCRCSEFAETISRVLCGNNTGLWTVTEEHFLEDDKRNGYSISLINGNANTVTIIISPDRNNNQSNEQVSVNIEAYDDGESQQNPYTCDVTRNGVVTILRANGVNVSLLQNRGGNSQDFTHRETFLQQMTQENTRSRALWMESVRRTVQI